MYRPILFLQFDDTPDTGENAERVIANTLRAKLRMVMLEYRIWRQMPVLCRQLLDSGLMRGAHFRYDPALSWLEMWAYANNAIRPTFGFCDAGEEIPSTDARDSHIKQREYVEYFRTKLRAVNGPNRPTWLGSSSHGEVFDLTTIKGSRDQDWTKRPLDAAATQALRMIQWRGSGAVPLGTYLDMGWWGERSEKNWELYPPKVYRDVWKLSIEHDLGLTYRSGLARMIRTDDESNRVLDLIACMETQRELLG